MLAAAADVDQAALLTESMETERLLNPWIKKRVGIGRGRAWGKGGYLKIITSDAPSASGHNVDVFVFDEVTMWEKRDLWDVVLTGREKRPGSVLLVITNAGVRGSWQEGVLAQARTNSDWDVYESPEGVHLASWMDAERIAKNRLLVTPAMAKRMYDNKWVDPGEDSGFLSREDVQACEESGRALQLIPTRLGRRDVDYVAGIDYGPKRDRTALSVLHHAHDGTIRVDELTVLQGSPGQPVPIAAVEGWVEDINRRFHRPMLVIDPYQMEGTVQKYEYHQQVVRFESRGGKSNYEMASTLRSLVANKRLVWYAGAGDLPLADGRVETFADELCGLVIRATIYGYRFDHQVSFHDDRACSVGMAVLYAARNPPAPQWLPPPSVEERTRSPALPELRPVGLGRPVWGITE
jgi:hypothetical protein